LWLNEYHGDFLVNDRLEEARRAAAHRHLVETLRRRDHLGPRRLAAAIASLGRRLRALL
jgi:hypothetical protein